MEWIQSTVGRPSRRPEPPGRLELYSCVWKGEPEPSFLAARFSFRRSLSVRCGFFLSCFFGLSALLLMTGPPSPACTAP